MSIFGLFGGLFSSKKEEDPVFDPSGVTNINKAIPPNTYGSIYQAGQLQNTQQQQNYQQGTGTFIISPSVYNGSYTTVSGQPTLNQNTLNQSFNETYEKFLSDRVKSLARGAEEKIFFDNENKKIIIFENEEKYKKHLNSLLFKDTFENKLNEE